MSVITLNSYREVGITARLRKWAKSEQKANIVSKHGDMFNLNRISLPASVRSNSVASKSVTLIDVVAFAYGGEGGLQSADEMARRADEIIVYTDALRL